MNTNLNPSDTPPFKKIDNVAKEREIVIHSPQTKEFLTPVFFKQPPPIFKPISFEKKIVPIELDVVGEPISYSVSDLNKPGIYPGLIKNINEEGLETIMHVQSGKIVLKAKEPTEVKKEENLIQKSISELETYFLMEQALLEDLKQKQKTVFPSEKLLVEKVIGSIHETSLANVSTWNVLIGEEYADAFLNQIPSLVEVLGSIKFIDLDEKDRVFLDKLKNCKETTLKGLADALGLSQTETIKTLLYLTREAEKGPEQAQIKALEKSKNNSVLTQLSIDEMTMHEKIINTQKSESKPFILPLRNEQTKTTEIIDLKVFIKKNGFDEVLDAYKRFLNNINNYELSDKSISFINKASKMFFYHLLIRAKIEDKANEVKTIESIAQTVEKYISRLEKSLNKVAVIQNPKIESLLKLRKSNPEEELKRLMTNPRVSKSIEKWGDHLLKNPQQFEHILSNEDTFMKRLVAYGQSLEIREVLKENYYVVNHAQPVEAMFLNILARELKAKYEQNQHENFQVLRHNIFLEEIPKERDVDWYKKNMKRDVEFGNELISGDVFLESIESGESALDYFTFAPDIENERVKKLTEKILEYYIPNEKTREKFIEKFDRLIRKSRDEAPNLYSICIPKNKMEEVSYFSMPYGIASEKSLTKEELAKVQSGKMKTKLQVRLLSTQLQPENGVHIVLNSPIEKKKLEMIEENIKLLVQEALTQFLFEK